MELTSITELELDKICQKCVEFNPNRLYSINKVNCQYFVEKVWNTITNSITIYILIDI